MSAESVMQLMLTARCAQSELSLFVRKHVDWPQYQLHFTRQQLADNTKHCWRYTKKPRKRTGLYFSSFNLFSIFRRSLHYILLHFFLFVIHSVFPALGDRLFCPVVSQAMQSVHDLGNSAFKFARR